MKKTGKLLFFHLFSGNILVHDRLNRRTRDQKNSTDDSDSQDGPCNWSLTGRDQEFKFLISVAGRAAMTALASPYYN